VFEAVARPDVYLRNGSRRVVSVSDISGQADYCSRIRIVGGDIWKKAE